MAGTEKQLERQLAAALSQLERLERRDSFDPSAPDSKPTKPQQEFLSDIGRIRTRIIRAGNRSGKSQVVAKEVSWILQNNHPNWKRPESWGTLPILILVAGQDRKMMEIELWGKKILPFLNAAEWRESRVGGSLQFAENRKNGDKVVFLSHADSSEKNRKHMQGYTANYVWVDEMPSSASLFDEIRLRASTPDAMFVATFTPKFRSEEIRNVVDAIKEPHGKLYKFRRLDNPLYKGREAEVHADLEGYSEQYKKSVLEGDWFVGDSAVYEWKPSSMIEAPGDNYSQSWRHVVSVDPALKSKFGYTLWAERPTDGKWFLMQSAYIEGIYSPDDMVSEVKRRIEPFNIVRRVSDPHESWFIGQASKAQLTFIFPHDKTNRKGELMKNFQAALNLGIIAIPPWNTEFIAEVTGCQWAENADRIINSSSFHLMDCAHYFVDCKPAYDPKQAPQTWAATLRIANSDRKKQEKEVAAVSKWGRVKPRPIKQWPRRGNYKIWS